MAFIQDQPKQFRRLYNEALSDDMVFASYAEMAQYSSSSPNAYVGQIFVCADSPNQLWVRGASGLLTAVRSFGVYNVGSSYRQDDIVIQGNQVYTCLTATTGTFKPQDWQAINIGPSGKLITSSSYDSNTGKVTFNYSDGSSLMTVDLRGLAGRGVTSISYGSSTGLLTFNLSDGTSFVSGDIRGASGISWTTLRNRWEWYEDFVNLIGNFAGTGRDGWAGQNGGGSPSASMAAFANANFTGFGAGQMVMTLPNNATQTAAANGEYVLLRRGSGFGSPFHAAQYQLLRMASTFYLESYNNPSANAGTFALMACNDAGSTGWGQGLTLVNMPHQQFVGIFVRTITTGVNAGRGELSLAFRVPGVILTSISSTVINTNQAYNIAFELDRGALLVRGWLDGVLFATISLTSSQAIAFTAAQIFSICFSRSISGSGAPLRIILDDYYEFFTYSSTRNPMPFV